MQNKSLSIFKFHTFFFKYILSLVFIWAFTAVTKHFINLFLFKSIFLLFKIWATYKCSNNTIVEVQINSELTVYLKINMKLGCGRGRQVQVYYSIVENWTKISTKKFPTLSSKSEKGVLEKCTVIFCDFFPWHSCFHRFQVTEFLPWRGRIMINIFETDLSAHISDYPYF